MGHGEDVHLSAEREHRRLDHQQNARPGILNRPDGKTKNNPTPRTYENRLVAGREPFASSGGLAGSRNDAETVLDTSKSTTVQLDTYTRAIAQLLEVPLGMMKRVRNRLNEQLHIL